MDWHYSKVNGSYACAVLDDASRIIPAAEEFDNQTAEHSIELFNQAYNQYSHISPIREVITDHGSQFHANKRDKDGYANHSFENYCARKGIRHILCKYNHPQSNGKIEKWFGLYNRKRNEFETFGEMITWYNTIRPHLSLNVDELETPQKAFYRKCDDIILGNYIRWIEREVEVKT